LAAIGDLVEDIAIEVGSPINIASDTDATILRRRGGSAANVATAAARSAGRARFLGQVGDDAVGATLVAELSGQGVDVGHVRLGGRSGTIVVLVDVSGERTMLVDRGSTRALDCPEQRWLDDVDVLHVPFYSLAVDPIAATTTTLIEWCHARRIAVSIDVSSVAVLTDYGVDRARRLVERLRPDAVFANHDEADLLAIDGPLGNALTFVKRGARAASVHLPTGATITEPALALELGVDTTGAGDAFAAGVLTFPGWKDRPGEACIAGHRAAHALLAGRAAG
jgi:sugar/nucleoside kinase (ribokinase family)